METPTTETKKGFVQNDRLLVCSLFAFYGLCFFSLIIGSFWWLNRRNQMISINATATSVAFATQRADATATAIAHATEQGQFEFIDHFDDNSGRWLIETPFKYDNWEGSLQIKDGVYAWDINKIKEPFVHQMNFIHEFPFKDFNTYVDSKFSEGASRGTCSGLTFRKSLKGWDYGAYIFTLCNDFTFSIAYYDKDGWDIISGRHFSNAIQPSDWNRLEIVARGNHFIFRINNQVVYDLKDERLTEGALGLIIEIHHQNPTEVWFDNFAYQTP